MNVLIACEESQVVCKAFRDKGHNAYSCDLKPCSGDFPEWHIQGDVLEFLNPRDIVCIDGSFYSGIGFITMDYVYHEVFKWDLIIAHPPCTYLCVTGNRWFDILRYGDAALERQKQRELAIDFFMKFVNCSCDHIAIENPVGVMSSFYCKPDQYIHPYMFGDPFEKKTGLWLKGLPLLVPTNLVQPEPRAVFRSGCTMPAWYAYAPLKDRAKYRSKTFPGIARAMAEQWG